MKEHYMENHTQTTPEMKHNRQEEINAIWNDATYKIPLEGKELTLRECYDKAIESEQILFESIKKITDIEVPPGTYILYVNATKHGIAGNPDIASIQTDRLEKMYEAETGSSHINPEHFQEKNMRRCLGFEESEQERFKVVHAFTEDMPTDLTGCVGIVFSGSEADITDEVHIERVHMTERARGLVRHAEQYNIPRLGICFGGQLLANEKGAQIKWVLDAQANKVQVFGIDKVSQTNTENPLLIDFPEDSFSVAENHGQHIDKNSLPKEATVLAENEAGGVEIVYFKDTNTVCTQFHPEISITRLDIAESLKGDTNNPKALFQHNLTKIKGAVFPNFIKMAGRYARKE